jgi:hypothetical protein
MDWNNMLEYCVWKNSYISFIWVCFKWKLSILGMYGWGVGIGLGGFGGGYGLYISGMASVEYDWVAIILELIKIKKMEQSFDK